MPDAPAPEIRFRHADEEEWQEVRVIGDDNGRRMAVREKWLEFTPGSMTLLASWDPGMIIRKHGHNSRQVIYVLKGSMRFGDVECSAGMQIVLEQGMAGGPMIAGPEGVELFEVFMGDARSWSDDQADYEALLAEQGLRELPHAKLRFPEWMNYHG
ncbi:hypothetical protein [Sphingomonas crocodyli]|uniref:Cupin domain-containing protein n=1 Tax=Sphingomonas crocodyli TaxID=1979270 RepID=A0A437LV88_9SPHN|nr:hypothetical protein [Sphingomonas crocodyli]RVT89203.1 hypothetical protein EOD43_23110 [Sphingomonas crocodyli]